MTSPLPPGQSPPTLDPASMPDVTFVSSTAPPLAEPIPPAPAPRHRRRIQLPLILFVLTCFSTFLAGATGYFPFAYVAQAFGLNAMPLRRAIYTNWREGLLYMGCVVGILLAHEMGHFVLTLIHRVRASLPFFIPFPISPIGTMGAVIAMDGRSANRREIFDIGLAGPIAGLIVALPIMWIGVQQLDLQRGPADISLQAPLVMRLAIDHVHPGKYDPAVGFSLTKVNAWFMAGWVGMLITGLNMLPVSQLDGGHVTYALFGRRAHWIARGFMLLAFGYMIVTAIVSRELPTWVPMAILIMVIGTDHPPTRDDNVSLGWFRTALGYASLTIPVFCFVPNLQI